MKIFDFKQYNEKLKINPIGLKEFDKLDAIIDMTNHITKQDLVTGDIVQLNDGLYMAFIKDDMLEGFINQYGKDIIERSCGIFFYSRINKNNEFIPNYMPFNEYNNDLACKSSYINDELAAKWSVSVVYKRMDDFTIPTNIKDITQDYLKNLIEKYKFLKINLNHEDN